MANKTKWSAVAVAVQSVLAGAVTVTAISKANPGVVSATAHGYANGDFVLVTAAGMGQVDGRVFRVSGSAANTFNLEGEDTTNYDTFTSGSVQKITFGTNLSTLVDVSASGGEFDMIETTTIHDSVRSVMPGVASAAVFDFNGIWDLADAGNIALKAASDAAAQRAVRFTFANGQKMLFSGYVGATMLPNGGSQELVKTAVKITAAGRPTYYAT